MPKLLRLQAAQPKIAHWVMNNGYSIRKGGVGTVNIIVKLQPMLIIHAKISSVHLRGLLFQSSLTQSLMLYTTSEIKESYLLFRGWCSVPRDLHWLCLVRPCVQYAQLF